MFNSQSFGKVVPSHPSLFSFPTSADSSHRSSQLLLLQQHDRAVQPLHATAPKLALKIICDRGINSTTEFPEHLASESWGMTRYIPWALCHVSWYSHTGVGFRSVLIMLRYWQPRIQNDHWETTHSPYVYPELTCPVLMSWEVSRSHWGLHQPWVLSAAAWHSKPNQLAHFHKSRLIKDLDCVDSADVLLHEYMWTQTSSSIAKRLQLLWTFKEFSEWGLFIPFEISLDWPFPGTELVGEFAPLQWELPCSSVGREQLCLHNLSGYTDFSFVLILLSKKFGTQNDTPKYWSSKCTQIHTQNTN